MTPPIQFIIIIILDMLDQYVHTPLQVVNTQDRMAAVRSLLCLAHGMFASGTYTWYPFSLLGWSELIFMLNANT